MTPEAVGATPDPQGHRAETGRTVAGTPAAPDMNGQLGSQAATWNLIKTVVTKESQAKSEQVAAVASTEQPEAIKLDFTPTEVERRTASKAQNRAIGEIAPIKPFRIIAVSSAAVSRSLKNIRPTKERFCRVFRNPLSTVVAVLLFSVVYRGLMLPSRKGMTIPRLESYDTRANSDSANSLLNVSASPGRTAHRSTPPLILSPAKAPPQAFDRVQRHLSHDDYVAKILPITSAHARRAARLSRILNSNTRKAAQYGNE